MPIFIDGLETTVLSWYYSLDDSSKEIIYFILYETTWPLRAIAAERLPKWRTRKKMAMKRRIFGKLSFNDWLCSVSNLAIVVDQTRPTVLIYFAFLVKGVTIPWNLIFVVWLLMITIFLVDTTKFSNSKQLCRNTEVLSFKLDQFGLTLVVLILLLVKAYVDSCLNHHLLNLCFSSGSFRASVLSEVQLKGTNKLSPNQQVVVIGESQQLTYRCLSSILR